MMLPVWVCLVLGEIGVNNLSSVKVGSYKLGTRFDRSGVLIIVNHVEEMAEVAVPYPPDHSGGQTSPRRGGSTPLCVKDTGAEQT